MLLKLAWRNLWRQKRRTLITASALAVALFLSIIMRSFQEGQYTSSIENNAKLGTGMIQLQHPKFKENHSINYLVSSHDSFIQPANEVSSIVSTLPRIESFVLVASDNKSKGIQLVGFEPNKKAERDNLITKITSGEYLVPDENAVLIASGVAEFLNVKINDDIVFYGQGYRGNTAAGLYKVKGIVHFPMKEMNNNLVYMPLKAAQGLLSTGNNVTNWLINLSDLSQLESTKSELSEIYVKDVSIRDWRSLSPDLKQNIDLDRISGVIMMYLLYLIVGFGLFATLLMMTMERQREFAVMLATGMQRSILVNLLLLESLLIGMLGAALGILLSLPINSYFYLNPIKLTGEMAQAMVDVGFEPILPVALRLDLYMEQIGIVLLLLALGLIYPIFRTSRIAIASSLKGGRHAS